MSALQKALAEQNRRLIYIRDLTNILTGKRIDVIYEPTGDKAVAVRFEDGMPNVLQGDELEWPLDYDHDCKNDIEDGCVCSLDRPF